MLEIDSSREKESRLVLGIIIQENKFDIHHKYIDKHPFHIDLTCLFVFRVVASLTA